MRTKEIKIRLSLEEENRIAKAAQKAVKSKARLCREIILNTISFVDTETRK